MHQRAVPLASKLASLAARCRSCPRRSRRRRLLELRALRLQSLRQQPPVPPQETTGSIASRPAASARVESQPLPAPSRPATVAASGGVATGAQGLGAYRPGESEVTGSVSAPRAPAPTGHWTWDGGSPVTVAAGETVEMIARKYGVPASAIMETNGFREGTVASARPAPRHSALRFGQRWSGAGAPCASAPRGRKRAYRRARRKPDGHRPQARRHAHGLGARQQHPALCQGQHRRRV